jgi:hypothetical protein
MAQLDWSPSWTAPAVSQIEVVLGMDALQLAFLVFLRVVLK